MSNKHEGKVSIRLDRPRILKFGLNAMAAFEDAMDVSLAWLLGQVQEEVGDPESDGYNPSKAAKVIGVRHVRAMLWASLLHEEPTLTLEAAGDLVDYAPGNSPFDKILHVQSKVMEAFAAMQNPTDPNPTTAAQGSAPHGGTGRPSKK